MWDLHTHTTYSDGAPIEEMVRAAGEAGLSGIGLTDHCIVYDDPVGRSDRYDFEDTYEQRRAEIEGLRGEYDLAIADGVEMNYDPDREDEIRTVLEEADFEYAIGSVHYADDHDITAPDLANATPEERRAVADSPTVPEINAGRIDGELGRIHPDPAHLPAFAEEGVGFVVGSDAHGSGQLRTWAAMLADVLPELPVEILPAETVVEPEGRR